MTITPPPQSAGGPGIDLDPGHLSAPAQAITLLAPDQLTWQALAADEAMLDGTEPQVRELRGQVGGS